MVVPWIGFPLYKLLAQAQPPAAKICWHSKRYTRRMICGTRKIGFIGGGLKYPYVEGTSGRNTYIARTLMTVGVYGKGVTPQNSAPIRLIVPWKYGLKVVNLLSALNSPRTSASHTEFVGSPTNMVLCQCEPACGSSTLVSRLYRNALWFRR